MIRSATTADAAIIALLAIITFDETFGHLFKERSVLLHYFEIGKYQFHFTAMQKVL